MVNELCPSRSLLCLIALAVPMTAIAEVAKQEARDGMEMTAFYEKLPAADFDAIEADLPKHVMVVAYCSCARCGWINLGYPVMRGDIREQDSPGAESSTRT